VSILAAIRRG